MKQSFIPNFIHSLDAANIHLLINKILEKRNNNDDNDNNNIMNLFTIHDCFATTPDNIDYINSVVRLTFAELYLNSVYLDKMRTNIIEQIKSFIGADKHIIKENTLSNTHEPIEYFLLDNNKKLIIPSIPFQHEKLTEIFLWKE